jgi:GTP-binding protein
LLLVDAFEGPMPQTRFVLRKALQLDLKPIVVVNKIDRPEARPHDVVDEVLELFIELGADDDQLEFPVVYASSREGFAISNLEDEQKNLQPLFETILEKVPAPKGFLEQPLQLLVSSIDYDEYVGRIAIGRVERGSVRAGQQAVICKKDGTFNNIKVNRLYTYEGLKRADCSEAMLGDIVAVSGVGDITIGETICDVENPEPLPFIDIDEPTIAMTFSVNNSPFAGREGTYVTSRHLRERLFKELETNVSLRVEETETPDSFNVSGRGELHLSILIETMRRQGYEFQVSKPTVINKEVAGMLYEPIEYLIIDVPEDFMGVVMEKLGVRKSEMVNMHSANQGYMRLEFKIPARGLIGYRSEFLTDTKGNGIMNHVFHGFEPFKGDIPNRQRGSMMAWENGDAVGYGLYNAQERGTLFISPGTKVYEGMIVGENARAEDIVVNVCKKKHVTNMRASGTDDSLRLTPVTVLSLEQSLEFIADDELVEVTPKSIRLRKRMLDSDQRAKVRSRVEK